MKTDNIQKNNNTYLQGLERSSQFSYSAQYFWWKKYNVLKKTVKDILKKSFNKTTEIRILDIGCQIGHDVFKLSDEFKHYNIKWYGIDINPDFLKICLLRKPLHKNHEFSFLTGSIEQIPIKKDKFDIIICSEVMEHLHNTDNSIKNLYSVLKTKKYLIISTPNINNYAFNCVKFIIKNYLKSVYSKFKETDNKQNLYKNKTEVKQEEDHINLKNIDEWKSLFTSKKFCLIKVKRGSMFYGSNFIDKYPVLFIIITLFDVIFDYIPLFNKWSYNFFMLLKKRN